MILGKYTKKNGGSVYINLELVETLEHAEGGGSDLHMFSGKVVTIQDSPSDLVFESPTGVDIVGGLKEC